MAIADFNQNIPQADDQPSQSQGEILDNFGADYLIWNVNHFTFDEIGIQGKHRFIQMPITAVAPSTAVNEYAMYTFPYSTYVGDPTPTTQLIIKKPNTGPRIPFTSTGGSGAEGWSWLASGILMKWGEFNIANNSADQPVDYSLIQPVFNNPPFSVMLSANGVGYGLGGVDPNFSIYLTENSTMRFQFRAYRRTSGAIPGAAARLNWVAIGPATASGL